MRSMFAFIINLVTIYRVKINTIGIIFMLIRHTCYIHVKRSIVMICIALQSAILLF